MSLASPEHKRLGLARLLMGALLLLRTTPILTPLHPSFLNETWPLFGWPPSGWHASAFDLALPPRWVALLCVVRALATVAFAVGIRARAAGIATGILGYIVLSQDVLGYFNSIHLLYASAVLLAVAGGGAAIAIRPEPARAPRSGLALIRWFVASVYAWSGLAKLNAGWLEGATLARLHDERILGGGLVDWLLVSQAGRLGCAWGIVALELSLGPLLLWRRTRRPAIVVALVFHALVEHAVRPDVFGLAMAALLVTTFWESAPPVSPELSGGQRECFRRGTAAQAFTAR